jgi:hypothetical protein
MVLPLSVTCGFEMMSKAPERLCLPLSTLLLGLALCEIYDVL